MHPPGRFGELGFDANFAITGFNEKPQTEEGYINAGYMFCNRRLFEFTTEPATEECPPDKQAPQMAEFSVNAIEFRKFGDALD